jgi:hypothetical protein
MLSFNQLVGLPIFLFPSGFPTKILYAFFLLYVRYPRVRFSGTTKKKVVGLERGPLSLVSTTEELLDRKVAAPV